MTVFMPPIQRKKKVTERYCPDSFRVISEDAISDHPKYAPRPYRASFEPQTPTPRFDEDIGNEQNASKSGPVLKSTRVLPKVLPDYRGHKPQPLSCGFLDKNVRFLNEPICNVYTNPLHHEEKKWWPSRPNPGELVTPPHTNDSNYRISYSCKQEEKHKGSGRHSSNLNRDPARGIVPVNYQPMPNNEKRCYKEDISYEHIYSSRTDPNYPIRGKRHGAFVWKRMDPISQRKFIEYHQKLDEEERKFEEMKSLTERIDRKGVDCGQSANKKSPTAYTTARLLCEETESPKVNKTDKCGPTTEQKSVMNEIDDQNVPEQNNDI